MVDKLLNILDILDRAVAALAQEFLEASQGLRKQVVLVVTTPLIEDPNGVVCSGVYFRQQTHALLHIASSASRLCGGDPRILSRLLSLYNTRNEQNTGHHA